MASSHRWRWVLAVVLSGCQREPPPTIDVQPSVATPAPDISDHCVDIGGAADGTRVCASPKCPGGSCVVTRPEPAWAAASPLGWRCVGTGKARTCLDRSDGVGRFSCNDGHCVQLHPRRPDANEWSCADAGGAALCLRRARAAGVVQSPRDPAFVCDASLPNADRQLCIDWSPDFPDGRAGRWSCHYEAEPTLRRVCIEKNEPTIGSTCDAKSPCPPGARCLQNRCVPPALTPSCWLDKDCDGGRCRLGSCIAER